jgi:RNA polymerase sigma-70 factor (ECF subfamily)
VSSFDDAVAQLFTRQFGSLFRYLDRLAGDPDLASDLAQEAFVKLHERGSMPDTPRAWLATVATNLLRDSRRTAHRRERLILHEGARVMESNAMSIDDAVVADETRERVRAALATLASRDRQLLLLRHEGYSYRELAEVVGVAETSVGTLLVRASRAFRDAFTEPAQRGASTTADAASD